MNSGTDIPERPGVLVQPAGPDRFLIIIGAMKSGTTSLFRLLAQHPQIARPSNKEPGFFSADDYWSQGLDTYRQLWNWNPNQHKIAMEASTGYAKYPFEPNVPERMASLKDCEFRFVYMLRNPFQRIESHFRHGMYKGWNKSLDHGFDGSSYPIQITRYASQIDRYMQHFPRSSLLVATLDELEADPAPLLRRVCEHAGVDPDFAFNNTAQIANPGTRYKRAGWINKIEESQNGPTRAIRRAIRSIVGDERLKSLMNGRGTQVDLGRHHLSEDERQKVLELIGDDLKRLKSEHGIDPKAVWDINV